MQKQAEVIAVASGILAMGLHVRLERSGKQSNHIVAITIQHSIVISLQIKGTTIAKYSDFVPQP